MENNLFNPASEAQINYLKRLGYTGETEGLTSQECSQKIQELVKAQAKAGLNQSQEPKPTPQPKPTTPAIAPSNTARARKKKTWVPVLRIWRYSPVINR